MKPGPRSGSLIKWNQCHLSYKTARVKQCFHYIQTFHYVMKRCKDDMAVFPKADTDACPVRAQDSLLKAIQKGEVHNWAVIWETEMCGVLLTWLSKIKNSPPEIFTMQNSALLVSHCGLLRGWKVQDRYRMVERSNSRKVGGGEASRGSRGIPIGCEGSRNPGARLRVRLLACCLLLQSAQPTHCCWAPLLVFESAYPAPCSTMVAMRSSGQAVGQLSLQHPTHAGCGERVTSSGQTLLI